MRVELKKKKNLTIYNSYFGTLTSTTGQLQLCCQDFVRLTRTVV